MADINSSKADKVTTDKIKKDYPYFLNYAKSLLKGWSVSKIHFEELLQITITNVLSREGGIEDIVYFRTYVINAMKRTKIDIWRKTILNSRSIDTPTAIANLQRIEKSNKSPTPFLKVSTPKRSIIS